MTARARASTPTTNTDRQATCRPAKPTRYSTDPGRQRAGASSRSAAVITSATVLTGRSPVQSAGLKLPSVSERLQDVLVPAVGLVAAGPVDDQVGDARGGVRLPHLGEGLGRAEAAVEDGAGHHQAAERGRVTPFGRTRLVQAGDLASGGRRPFGCAQQ